MTNGLQISLRGDELSRRITERIRQHEATVSVLDARITRRAGDGPFDVRPEDGFETLNELMNERQRYRSRISGLTLIRDNLVAGEVYALTRADLRLADLISADPSDGSEIPDAPSVLDRKSATIDGLRLTIPGEELRGCLEQRIREHQRRAESWRKQAHADEEHTEEEVQLPDHICANEAERHEWRADVLGFIRDHIDAAVTYRLGEADLAFGELLPGKPAWMEQEEYEEQMSAGSNPRGRYMPAG